MSEQEKWMVTSHGALSVKVSDARGDSVALVYHASVCKREERARLIAAAPDLLSFVMRATKADRPGDAPYWIELCEAARAALAKATGV